MLKNYTQAEIKEAYKLVTADLLNSLKKAKKGAEIKLGSLGAFTKNYKEMKSGLDQEYYGYYLLSFRMFPRVKKELEK